MSTSPTAGPSRLPHEVSLSIEPVHIYTDPNPSPSTSIIDLFERERKLQDITADGTNVFATRQPASVQLGEDVRRLWAERGDFSKFRSSQLKRDREEAVESSEDEEEDGDEGGQAKKNGDDDANEALLRQDGEKVGGTIGESEFVELRNKVLGNLDVAHFNSIHAHQLLGMLIKQHRSASTQSSGVAGRMGSPAPSLGGQSNRSSNTVAAPSKAPLGIFSHLNAANREEEFILDPLAISLSRTSLNSSSAVRHTIHPDDASTTSDDDYADTTSAAYGLKQAQREIESAPSFKKSQLRELKVVIETKRKAISNAAELLSSAAAELRASHAPNRERWRALIGLHGRGWGLTPGRPLLDVERFGVTNEEEEEEVVGETKKKEEKKPAGLQGFGTPIVASDGKVKEEGARDAWIGFGLPEAPVELRRRSLAYWADGVGGASTVEEVKKKIVFPDRMYRRLRVRFVLWRASGSTGGEEERAEWSSDAPSAKAAEDGGAVIVGQILDQELQQASSEATDELVFGDVVAQARRLPPSFGVRLTPTSVRIVLTKRLDLVVELVSSTTASSSDTEEKSIRYAPHAALLVAYLRMGPLRKYQAFVAATEQARRDDANARAAAIKAAALGAPKKSNTTEAKKGGIAAGGKSTSVALSKLDSIGPVLVGLHYWSFVHRLGTLLGEIQQSFAAKGLKISIQLIPITTAGGKGIKKLQHLTQTLSTIIDAVPSAQESTIDTLQGFAKVYWARSAEAGRGRLLCTLSFAQPSLLSVEFADLGKGSRVTKKRLAVDLDTLNRLLVQQLQAYI